MRHFGERGAIRGQKTCWDRGLGTALKLAVVTMETVWRSLACIGIIAMVASGVAESWSPEDFAQSQGKILLCFSVYCDKF